MNTTKLKGKLNEKKGNAEQKVGEALNSDKTFIKGKTDEVKGRVQQKAAETKEKVFKKIEKM